MEAKIFPASLLSPSRNVLRMTAGISKKGFSEKFGRPVTDVYAHQLEECIRDGLILDEGDVYRLTGRGLDISNYVFAKFL